MPASRIAAAVETGDDCYDLVGFCDEHQRIRKAPQQGAANVFVDDRELTGIGRDALNRGLDGEAEMPAQTRGLAFVPVLRVNEFLSGRLG
jgi:hypothetical protein